MVWYATAEPYHASVLHIGVHDLGEVELSHRRYTSSAFRRISISPTSCGHLTLVVASRGSPHGAGVSGYSVLPQAFK
jgi:hypothetical protein